MPTIQLGSNWSFEVILDPQNHALILAAVHALSGARVAFMAEDRIDNRHTIHSSRELMQPDASLWQFFHEKTIITSSENAIEVVTCPIDADTHAPSAAFMAHYRFERLDVFPAVRVYTWFSRPEAMVCQDFSWLRMRPVGCSFNEYEGFDPPYSGLLADMKHSMRFGSLAVRNETCWVALTECGEALWAPENPDYSPYLMQRTDEMCRMGVFAPRATLRGQVNIELFSKTRPLMATFLFGTDKVVLPKTLPELALTDPETVPGELWELQGDGLVVALKQRPDGVTLAGISLDTFLPDFKASLGPLARLVVKSVSNGDVRTLSSESDWAYTKVSIHGRNMMVYLKDPQGLDGIAVHVQVSIDHASISFKTKILNDNCDWTVLYATYPCIGFAGGNPYAVLPQDSGVLLKDAYSHGYHLAGAYPNGFSATMPCVGLYNPSMRKENGLYIAVHDASGARKDITCDFLPTGQGLVEYAFGACNLGRPANAFELAGELVVRRFSGDWYDFGLIYRKFVHTHARWLPEHGREDSPKWMRDVPLYIMDWMPNDNPDADPVPISIRPAVEPERDDWYQTPIRLAKALGVPIGYHLYNWHWIPFNNDFPHYFPVKEGMIKGVDAMREYDIHVMPYINGRIWDTKDRRGEDYRFSKEALIHTSKSRDGMPDLETYASHEPDGSLVRLAAMCPTSVLWREELSNIVKRLINECHVDAVYLDQIAAACINLCCDPAHMHTPGNGDWWVTAYRLLMDRLIMEKPDYCGFTTECNAEVYADVFDGFLTWAWISSSMVPVFPLIYGGYIAMLGRNTNGYKKNDLLYYRFHVAQAVLFGQQIGWINPDLVDVPEKLSFMKQMAVLRYRFCEHFNAGDMLRPPCLVGENPVFITDTGMGRSQMFVGETLLAGAWRHRKDGRVIIMLVNIGDAERQCNFLADLNEYNVGKNSVHQIYGNGTLIAIGDHDIDCELPPGGCLVLMGEEAVPLQ